MKRTTIVVALLPLIACAVGCPRCTLPSMTYNQLVSEIKNDNVKELTIAKTHSIVELDGRPTSGVANPQAREFFVPSGRQDMQDQDLRDLEQLLSEHDIDYGWVE